MMMMMMTMDGCVVENEKVKYFQNISFEQLKFYRVRVVLLSISIISIKSISSFANEDV